MKKLVGLPENNIKKMIENDNELRLLKDRIPAFEEGEHLHSELSIPELGLSIQKGDSVKIILYGNAAMARAAGSATLDLW